MRLTSCPADVLKFWYGDGEEDMKRYWIPFRTRNEMYPFAVRLEFFDLGSFSHKEKLNAKHRKRLIQR